tara:strand:- start:48 stop:290 length:243 start_codon:yes stop_codon:yes gene_type:complete
MVDISDVLARMPNCKARLAELVANLDTEDQFSLLGQDVPTLEDTFSSYFESYVEDIWQEDLQDLREHLDMLNARLAVCSE